MDKALTILMIFLVCMLIWSVITDSSCQKKEGFSAKESGAIANINTTYTDTYVDKNTKTTEGLSQVNLNQNNNLPAVSFKNNNNDVKAYTNEVKTQEYDLSSRDLLPGTHNEWLDDVGGAFNVDSDKLIDMSQQCQGVDTVGQSLKNPSIDMRGDIVIPKIAVGPWNNSSYDQKTQFKSLCSMEGAPTAV